MSNKSISYIVLAIAVIFVSIIFFTSSCNEKKINWSETYSEQKGAMKANPFNLDLLRICLKGEDFKTIDIDQSISKTLKSDMKNSTYFFVGDAIRADSSDWKTLAEFVKNGNDAFISSKYVANKFLKYFLKEKKSIIKKEKIEREIPSPPPPSDNEVAVAPEDEEEADIIEENSNDNVPPPSVEEDFYETEEITFNNKLESYRDSVVDLSLISPIKYQYETGVMIYSSKEKYATEWLYFNENLYSKDFFACPIQKIGTVDNLANCMCISYGAGKIFLHSNPVAFANVELTRISAKDYTVKLLSLLKKGDIYWDKSNRTSVSSAEMNDMEYHNYNTDDSDKKPKKTPLQYILSNEQLSWAWYSLVAMGCIFLLFSTKRRQRIIPVLAKNTNTSLAFIQTIGRIYFNRQDQNALSRLQYKQWQWFVRNRYGLVTNNINVEFEKRLSQKSGVPLTEIIFLTESGKYIETFLTGESNMTEFYKTLSAFYNKCK
jgi:hypothetical protein